MKKKIKTQDNLQSIISAPTLQAARRILGAKLTTISRGVRTGGIIVEVEAYDGRMDEAAHAFRGRTERTRVMFGEPGRAYVYFIYGMYHCVNIVTEREGTGCAVLIRALEPVEGIEMMRRRRGTGKVTNLCSGPGKLCEALGITKTHNGEDLMSSRKIFLEPHPVPAGEIIETTRIGITKSTHLPWRFYLKSKLDWVSVADRPKKTRARRG